MPEVIIVNDTQLPLHIALRHISPLHFVNNVPPGGQAVFKHVGRVWFTIEARIARSASDASSKAAALSDEAPQEEQAARDCKGKEEDEGLRARLRRAKENNEYTMLQSVAAPVAVSVAALSFGAGAIYLGAAASAAGGMSAAVSSISASAASQAPTVQRLYKYARKGYQVAQIGSVVGIGGKALSDGTKKAEEEPQKASEDTTTTTMTKKQVNAVRETLGYLVSHSAVKSHGWYMRKDRTFRIRGGPKAAELENWVIIETDTVEPFEIVSDDPNEKPDPEAVKEAQQHEKTDT